MNKNHFFKSKTNTGLHLLFATSLPETALQSFVFPQSYANPFSNTYLIKIWPNCFITNKFFDSSTS